MNEEKMIEVARELVKIFDDVELDDCIYINAPEDEDFILTTHSLSKIMAVFSEIEKQCNCQFIFHWIKPSGIAFSIKEE